MENELNDNMPKPLIKDEFGNEIMPELSESPEKGWVKYEFDEFRKEMREIERRHNQKFDKIFEKLDIIVKLLNNGKKGTLHN